MKNKLQEEKSKKMILNNKKFSIELLSEAENVHLDLGCGEGTFTIELAKRFPSSYVIAVDTLNNRLKKLERKIEKEKISNILLFKSEAFFFLHFIACQISFCSIHLLCPDPWPKKKHRFHRLISSEFAACISRKLSKNGIFHFSSDDKNYCDTTQRIFSMQESLRLLPLAPDKFFIKSDFEIQWLQEGKEVKHLFWLKE